MEITRQLLKQVREDLDQAIQQVAQKHGLELKTGNMSYSSTCFTAKIEGSCANGPTKMESDYEQIRNLYNLPPLNSMVNIAGSPSKHRIIGWKGRSVIVESDRGAKYRVNPDDIKG